LSGKGNVRAAQVDTGEVRVLLGKEVGQGGVGRREITGKEGPKEGDVHEELRERIGDKAGGRNGGFTQRGGGKGGGLQDKRSKREQGCM
jgi:hypothetical protein